MTAGRAGCAPSQTKSYVALLLLLLVWEEYVVLCSACVVGSKPRGSCSGIPRYPRNGTDEWMQNRTVLSLQTFWIFCIRPQTVGQCDPVTEKLLYWKLKNRTIFEPEAGWVDPQKSPPNWDAKLGHNWENFGFEYYYLGADLLGPEDQGPVECGVQWGSGPEEWYILRSYLTVISRSIDPVYVYQGNDLKLTCTDNTDLIDAQGNNKTRIDSVMWYAAGHEKPVTETPDQTDVLLEYQANPFELLERNGWQGRRIGFNASSPLRIVIPRANWTDYKRHYCRLVAYVVGPQPFYGIRQVRVIRGLVQ